MYLSSKATMLVAAVAALVSAVPTAVEHAERAVATQYLFSLYVSRFLPTSTF